MASQGEVVPVRHDEFAKEMRRLHKDAGVKAIHNGLRRSALSHYLAANPKVGIGSLARMAGTSEQTVKRHYLEALTTEDGVEWFQMGRNAA